MQRVFLPGSFAECHVNERTVPITPSHADTAHHYNVVAGLKRRREASRRLPPLAHHRCGTSDPWICHCDDDPEPSEHELDGWGDAFSEGFRAGARDALRKVWRLVPAGHREAVERLAHDYRGAA